jgi:hypothetical protein
VLTGFLALGLIPALAVSATGQEPSASSCTISGTAGDDVRVGTAGPDVLCGLGGDDVLAGLRGDDTLRGGPGDDTLLGGPRNDMLFGDAGNDVLVDVSGTNVLNGGPGTDRCFGSATTRFVGCELTLAARRSSARGSSSSGSARGAGQASAAPNAHFVRETSTVAVRDEDLVVSFEEVGLDPGARADIEVTGTRTVRTVCTNPGSGDTVLDTSSTASALETGTYTADAAGRIRGTRTLSVAPGRVEISGLDCSTTTTVTVTLRDLTHDTALTITR